ncbi:hypothetical protein PFISCL1PPCAC_9905, partial [Pristionchus fissidentatus]
ARLSERRLLMHKIVRCRYSLLKRRYNQMVRRRFPSHRTFNKFSVSGFAFLRIELLPDLLKLFTMSEKGTQHRQMVKVAELEEQFVRAKLRGTFREEPKRTKKERRNGKMEKKMEINRGLPFHPWLHEKYNPKEAPLISPEYKLED